MPNPEEGWKYVSEWNGDLVSIHVPFTTCILVQGGLQGKEGVRKAADTRKTIQVMRC